MNLQVSLAGPRDDLFGPDSPGLEVDEPDYLGVSQSI